jgi:hypothetical protein
VGDFLLQQQLEVRARRQLARSRLQTMPAKWQIDTTTDLPARRQCSL